MTILEIQKETDVNVSSNLSFYCYVTLQDSEQIIIDIEETEWRNGSYQSTGVIKKFRLEKLTYQNYSLKNHSWVNLHSIEVRGFRKDKGLRYRTEYFHSLSQLVIDQIPDKYHDYAREAFAKEVVELEEQLTSMTNEGVRIETRK